MSFSIIITMLIIGTIVHNAMPDNNANIFQESIDAVEHKRKNWDYLDMGRMRENFYIEYMNNLDTLEKGWPSALKDYNQKKNLWRGGKGYDISVDPTYVFSDMIKNMREKAEDNNIGKLIDFYKEINNIDTIADVCQIMYIEPETFKITIVTLMAACIGKSLYTPESVNRTQYPCNNDTEWHTAYDNQTKKFINLDETTKKIWMLEGINKPSREYSKSAAILSDKIINTGSAFDKLDSKRKNKEKIIDLNKMSNITDFNLSDKNINGESIFDGLKSEQKCKEKTLNLGKMSDLTDFVLSDTLNDSHINLVSDNKKNIERISELSDDVLNIKKANRCLMDEMNEIKKNNMVLMEYFKDHSRSLDIRANDDLKWKKKQEKLNDKTSNTLDNLEILRKVEAKDHYKSKEKWKK